MPYDTLSRKIKWGRFLHWILFGQNWPYLLLIVPYFWVADSWTLSSCCGLVAKLCQTLVTPWAAAFQAPLSIGFPRQEYWSGLPFPSPGDLLDPGIKPASPALAGRVFTAEPPGKWWTWTPSSVQFSHSVMYDSLWRYGLQHEHLIVLMKVLLLSVSPEARSKRCMVQA